MNYKRIVLQGGQAAGLSPTMPAWGTVLSESETNAMIRFIRSLKKP